MSAINTQNKKRSTYSAADLAKLEASIDDYWDKSRDLESETVNDLEKHLWLANGAAATVAIGYVQAKAIVPLWQYAGAWSFVVGVLLLVVMKFVSSVNSSRDRFRLQGARSRFDADEVTDDVFGTVRDRTFRILKGAYLVLQWSAGVAFIVGAVLTLVGVGRTV
jgi:hypothetical protein